LRLGAFFTGASTGAAAASTGAAAGSGRGSSAFVRCSGLGAPAEPGEAAARVDLRGARVRAGASVGTFVDSSPRVVSFVTCAPGPRAVHTHPPAGGSVVVRLRRHDGSHKGVVGLTRWAAPAPAGEFDGGAMRFADHGQRERLWLRWRCGGPL